MTNRMRSLLTTSLETVCPRDAESSLNVAGRTHQAAPGIERHSGVIAPHCDGSTQLSGWRTRRACKEIAIPVTAVFQNASLRGVINVDHTESLGISLAPLKIIHERPDEIALYRRPLVDGLSNSLDVRNKILFTLRIADAVAAIPFIVISRPILRDIKRGRRIVAMKSQQEIAQPLRENLPPHRTVGASWHWI